MVSIICGACSQTAEEIDTAAQKIVFGVEVSAPEARTALVNENGKYKAIWKAGDTFSVVQIADSDSALYSGTVAEDAASIAVNAEFEQSAATKFTYIFASPAATVSADCSYLEMSLLEEQSPAAMNTFDSTSDLILSNTVERESQPNGENVPFIAERISAVGKMTVKNLPLAEGEQVTSVTFTTTQPLAGTISNIKVSDIVAGNDALLNATYLNPKGTITINLPEPQSGEFTLYFSCLPATLPAGSEYSVTVTSTSSTYTKQAQIPSNLSFTAGRMTSFAVNMTDNSQDIASNNKILYTSSDGKIVTPYATDVFGATIVSNSYNNGQGVITFDSDVVTVGEYAFFNCGTLDSITLPEGLCEIKQFAFGSCSALKSINIPDNVVIIEGGAFLNNSIKQFSGKFASEDGLTLVMEKTLVAYASGNTAEHYTIPQSIAVIGRSAFNGSINLTGVTIPNGVVTLEDYAFCNCFKLAQIALPDSVTAIGEDAFFGCDKLVNISLGNGLTTIGCQAFVDCHSLRTVTLPASLTRISAGIFVDCNALETVYSLATTPPEAEYTYWASWTAFGKDNAQLKIYVPAASVEAYKAADGWKEYADAIFADADPANCQILYTSTDGNVVTPYAADVFGATIVSNTYENGQGVITFDGEVTSIGEAAFYDCRSLTSVTIPDSVTSIGHVAFYRCLHLAEFNGKFASEDKRCLIVDGELKFFAFAGVTEYTTPTNVTSIGCYAFAHSNNLTSITVSNGVNEICTWAFWGCGNLTNINLPNSLTKIGGAVFQDCSSLVSITIPSSLTKIEDSVFKNCTSLQSVYCQPTVPPTASTTMFENNAADRKIYVPASSVEAYKSAQYWSDYADAIVAEGATSGVVDLSVAGTANCYLVNGAGSYKFKAVKGNSLENFSNGYRADVLWESFGTSTTPNVGDLITNVAYKDGYISFSTPATFKSGNASIALRDSSGKILWSWHIWCSAEGWNDQVYPNNAGTMMDRNLGATSATPGDIGAFGLMYQWGRKDPFMGTCAMSGATLAASTGSWDVASSGNNMDFAVENPMTFATDWYGGGVAGEGWHTSESEKGLYDPCPVGYRLPDGGANGFLATALGTSSNAFNSAIMKWTNSGFTWTLADDTTAAWYPAVGYRNHDSGALSNVGSRGYYWSASPYPSNSYYAYCLYFYYGYVHPANYGNRGYGQSVRCVRE